MEIMSKKRKRPTPESLAVAGHGVDTHAHLDLPELKDDVSQVLGRAEQTGLAHIGNVFLGPQAYEQNKDLFAHRPQVFFVLGVHPHGARDADHGCLVRIQEAIEEDDRIKAVGEIGLDYYRDCAPRNLQQDAFQAQLELARDLDLPVVIHSRDAEEDTLRILDRAGYAQRPLLWHCFGGGPDLAAEILSRGWRISIPGTVTYSKATGIQEAVRTIPRSRMVLETDCPFLAPEPYRGKRNEPAMTIFTALKVAELTGQDPVQIWEETGQNAREFFDLT
jgi:TatD DNase family protein